MLFEIYFKLILEIFRVGGQLLRVDLGQIVRHGQAFPFVEEHVGRAPLHGLLLDLLAGAVVLAIPLALRAFAIRYIMASTEDARMALNRKIRF